MPNPPLFTRYNIGKALSWKKAALVALGLLCWMPALLVGILCLGGK